MKVGIIMNNEEIYNKIMNLKIENANGEKIDYLSKEAKSDIEKVRKEIRTVKKLLKLFLILTIVSLVIIFIFFLSSDGNDRIPILLQLIFYLNIILTIIFYCMLKLYNCKYNQMLKGYNDIDMTSNNIYYETYLNQNNYLDVLYLDKLLYVASSLISKQDANIMNNIYNCINDPKTYYIVHKDEINKSLMDVTDKTYYLVSGVISILENNHYLSILDRQCTKEEFIKSISSLDNSINFNKIGLNEDNLEGKKNKVKNWVYSVNKVLKENNKAIILFELGNISNDKVILFITNFYYLFDFITMPEMNYICEKDLFKDKPENKKKYELALLIRKYGSCDNYIKLKSEEFKDIKNSEEYIKAINGCKTWNDIYILDNALNEVLNRKSDTNE